MSAQRVKNKTSAMCYGPRKPKRSDTVCRPRHAADLDSYEAVVSDYIINCRIPAEEYRNFYRDLPSLTVAIETAAWCKLPNNKRHPHQRRIPAELLSESNQRLQRCADKIRLCRSFDELHALVEARIGGIKGIAALTVYDIALRIGGHLGLEPELIYLHAGVTKGALALGLGRGQATLHPDELPIEFRRLRSDEIEDCLCIYKDHLNRISSGVSS